jgi:hypothetical protein
MKPNGIKGSEGNRQPLQHSARAVCPWPRPTQARCPQHRPCPQRIVGAMRGARKWVWELVASASHARVMQRTRGIQRARQVGSGSATQPL